MDIDDEGEYSVKFKEASSQAKLTIRGKSFMLIASYRVRTGPGKLGKSLNFKNQESWNLVQVLESPGNLTWTTFFLLKCMRWSL